MALRYDGGLNRSVYQDSAIPVVMGVRTRFTVAQVNAGATILPAIAGFRYRLIDAYAIAIGGAATTGTSVDILGTVTTARKLVAFLVAGLTQSTLLRAGAATNGVILADGASFTQNDANTAVTIGITGSAFTVMTSLDVYVAYVIDEA